MQKVVGSNPISRFEKGLHLQVFFVDAAGWRVCVAGHPIGTRRPTRAGVIQNTRVCRHFLMTRTIDLFMGSDAVVVLCEKQNLGVAGSAEGGQPWLTGWPVSGESMTRSRLADGFERQQAAHRSDRAQA
jgi:hypothetical protein